MLFRKERYYSRRNKIATVIFLLLLTVTIIVYIVKSFINPDYLEVTFIDVGQGDSAFIHTPADSTALIDGGGSISTSSKTGEMIIIPFLTKDGIFSLDKAIVSHYHEDHGKGVVEILDNLPVKDLYLPDSEERPPLHDSLVNSAENRGTAVNYIKRGDVVVLDEDTQFYTIFPDKEIFDNKRKNLNNDSLVLKLTYGEVSFLFVGDLEGNVEKLLPKEDLKSDVLKVGHHGSKTSTTQDFLDKISPKYAVISAALKNSYGHPHKDVVERLISARIETYFTGNNGSITFYADKNNILTVKAMLD